MSLCWWLFLWCNDTTPLPPPLSPLPRVMHVRTCTCCHACACHVHACTQMYSNCHLTLTKQGWLPCACTALPHVHACTCACGQSGETGKPPPLVVYRCHLFLAWGGGSLHQTHNNVTHMSLHDLGPLSTHNLVMCIFVLILCIMLCVHNLCCVVWLSNEVSSLGTNYRKYNLPGMSP